MLKTVALYFFGDSKIENPFLADGEANLADVWRGVARSMPATIDKKSFCVVEFGTVDPARLMLFNDECVVAFSPDGTKVDVRCGVSPRSDDEDVYAAINKLTDSVQDCCE